MRMRKLLSVRKALKDPKATDRLVEEIKQEISYNEKQYKARDKELNDLLKIISATKDIISNKPEEQNTK